METACPFANIIITHSTSSCYKHFGCNLGPSLDFDISVVFKNHFLILMLDAVQHCKKNKIVSVGCLKAEKHQRRTAGLGRSMIHQHRPSFR